LAKTYKLSLQVAKDTGYWGDHVRQIGYKKKKLGTGKSPLAGDRKLNSSYLFRQGGDRKTYESKGIRHAR
jgi:hypothetical protein